MKRGDRVRVRLLAKVDRGKIGTVVADSAPGEVILVEFDDEAVTHQFSGEDLELLD
jgi:hypothetical protein